LGLKQHLTQTFKWPIDKPDPIAVVEKAGEIILDENYSSGKKHDIIIL